MIYPDIQKLLEEIADRETALTQQLGTVTDERNGYRQQLEQARCEVERLRRAERERHDAGLDRHSGPTTALAPFEALAAADRLSIACVVYFDACDGPRVPRLQAEAYAQLVVAQQDYHKTAAGAAAQPVDEVRLRVGFHVDDEGLRLLGVVARYVKESGNLLRNPALYGAQTGILAAVIVAIVNDRLPVAEKALGELLTRVCPKVAADGGEAAASGDDDLPMRIANAVMVLDSPKDMTEQSEHHRSIRQAVTRVLSEEANHRSVSLLSSLGALGRALESIVVATHASD